jgi:hypothetical protein
MSAAQAIAPARLSKIVRVPVKPPKVNVPKSMSWSFDNDTGLTTLTVVTAVVVAALAGAAIAALAARTARGSDKRRMRLTF